MNNYEIYNERMSFGMEDKLFFLHEIGKSLKMIVDYGCANAALGKALATYNPDIIYVGIENNYKMLELASNNYPEGCYFESLEDFVKYYKGSYEHSAILFSSVLHEMYSYGSSIEWNLVSKFQFVVVRDMGLPRTKDYDKSVNFRYPLKTIINHINECLLPVPYELHRYKFGDYYQLWLKYRYEENWDREYRENYFACSQEEILDKLRLTFIPIHHRSFVHEYTRNQVIKDFGFDPFIMDTHYEMILINKTLF